MKVTEIETFFWDNKNKFITDLLNDTNILFVKNYLYNPDNSDYLDSLLEVIKNIFISIDPTKFSENEIIIFLKSFFNDNNKLRYFIKDLIKNLTVMIFANFKGNTDKEILFECFRTGLFWTIYPKAVKKCMGIKHCTSTIEYNELLDICKITEHQSTYNKNIDAFNIDSATYKRDDTKGLDLILHKNHSFKRPRIQKKHISRVKKKIDKLLVLYKGSFRDGGIFNNDRHNIPERFIDSVINRFY